MNLWPFSKKESKTGTAIYRNQPQAKFMSREYKSFADEGYKKNVIAFQAINKKAQAVADIPWILRDSKGNEITKSPLLDLINQPNPMQSRAEFIRSLCGFFDISGNSYIERTMVRGVPRELYVLRSDRMSIIPGDSGIPKGYKYKAGQVEVTFEVDQKTALSDIRHLKTFNPLDDWYGLSPIEAGAWSIDQHNEANKWNQALLQNGGAPSAIIQVKEGVVISDEERNRIKADIDEKVSGSGNAGRPLVLPDGLTWQSIGFNPDQMGIIENKYASARDISLAFGVPPIMLNIPGDSTYSNYQEARLAFYEETVIPLANFIRDELNQWLAPLFGDLKLDLDLDKVPAIVDKRMTLWDMADKSNDLTINERRELKGYEPIKDGDQLYIDAGKLPLGYDLGLNDTDSIDRDIEASKALFKTLAYGKE